MYLQKILLQNFRSYQQKLIEFDPHVNLIMGPNGSGKTNILEAIYLLTSGKSFRTSSLSNLPRWDQSFTSVKAKIARPDETEIEVQLIKDPNCRNLKRRFLIDKVQKTRKAFLGQLKTVVFDPEDVRLINGSPSRRREFIDRILYPVDWRYSQSLAQFNKALKHRNELLDLIFQQKASQTELFYWDQSLIKNSEIIHKFRSDFFRSANLFFRQHPNSEISQLSIKYLPSTITAEKLQQDFQNDLRRGYTQHGVHRDDYLFESSIFDTTQKDLSLWGSRGQQRLAVLALKLAEINYVEEISSDQPILLLDDIFSELDSEHQQLVIDICRRYQSFLTSSDDSAQKILPHALLINL